jgi:acyl carrier protein
MSSEQDGASVTFAEFHVRLVGFFQVTQSRIDAPITATTDLFDLGLMDSLHMVEVVLFLEETFGVEIPLDQVDAHVFRSSIAIFRALIGSEEHMAEGDALLRADGAS